MDDKYLLEHGYKEYNPTQFDPNSVVARFQKRFDDEFGKRYFIDVLKWDNSCIPTYQRGNWYKPFSYSYETQITMSEEENPINLEFFSSWKLEDVEKFMENFFEKMKPNYYEAWDEC